MKCPECVATGETSRVRIVDATTSLLPSDYFWDEDGVYHVHDPEVTTWNYKCDRGHTFSEPEYHPCFADGCDFGAPPALPDLAESDPVTEPGKHVTEIFSEQRVEIDRLTAELADVKADRTEVYREAMRVARENQDEIVRLRQGLWDVYGILGFDQDGDETPRAMVGDIVKLVTDAAREARKDYDDILSTDGSTELLLERLAAVASNLPSNCRNQRLDEVLAEVKNR